MLHKKVQSQRIEEDIYLWNNIEIVTRMKNGFRLVCIVFSGNKEAWAIYFRQRFPPFLKKKYEYSD